MTHPLKDHFAGNTTYYLFPGYFQNLRANFFFVSLTLFGAGDVQDGHRLFVGGLQIDGDLHPLRFVAFPV
jgi:hypothetical protein